MSDETSHASAADDRLDELFADYLDAAASGEVLYSQRLLDGNPGLAEVVTAYKGFGRFVEPLRGLTTTADFEPCTIEPLPSGTVIGDYEIVEEIGSHGQGVVYRARHCKINHVVALKMLLSGSRATESEARRFVETAENLAKLDHPNIVPIFGGGEHDGRLYFTMRLMEGGNLAERTAGKAMPPRKAARLAAVIARAVHHAHQRGILHRDLKPSNILLDAAGQPSVADFGLSKRLEIDTSDKGFYLVGAPPFIPPEQIEGQATVLSDVYGVGTILYWLLTGRPPILAGTATETLRLVRDPGCKPAPIRQSNDRVDRTLQAICHKCLEKDPEQRYRSADGLAKDLERWLHHERTEVPQPMRVRLWNWCRRNPGLASLSVATVVLLIFSVVMASLAAVDMEKRLRDDALRSNSRAAERVADNFRWLLRDVSDHVLESAYEEDVRTLLRKSKDLKNADDVKRFLETNEISQLHNRLKHRFERFNDELIQFGIPPFATTFFVNEKGRLVGHAGPLGRNLSIIGQLYDQRDYFTVARTYADKGKRGMEALHVSRVFKSTYDEYFKFAISMPVLDDDGSFLGVVLASIPMDDTLGLAKRWLHGEDQKVVLAGRVDPKPRARGGQWEPYMEHQYVILLHEAFGGEGKEKMRKTFFHLDDSLESGRAWTSIEQEVPELHLRPMERVEPHHNYKDPLRKIYPDEYGGAWLAGIARVGNTELMVIVQQKREEAIGQPTSLAKRFVLWGWGALALALIFAGTVVWYRQAKAAWPDRGRLTP